MAKILLIEDDIDVTKVMKKRLNDNGFDVFIANDPTEGISLARRERPDIILLDMKLPEGGGLSILRNLKTSIETKDIPVVVVTGVRNADVKDNAMREGAFAYIEKPYELRSLIGTIQNALSKKGDA